MPQVSASQAADLWGSGGGTVAAAIPKAPCSQVRDLQMRFLFSLLLGC